MILWKNKLQLILLSIKIMLRVHYIFAESEEYNTDSLKSSSYLLTMLEVEKRKQGHHYHHQSDFQNGGRARRTTAESSSQSSQHQLKPSSNFAAYFSGHEIIRYSDVNLDFDHFTIEFWLYVQGGQIADLVLLRIYNHCSFVDFSSITIGLKETNDNKDLRIYFKLRTIGVERYTTLLSHKRIDILKWTHIAAVFDGDKMTLYINQAKIAVSFQQNGLFLSNIYDKCTTLDIGGNVDTFSTFRGSLDKIMISNISKTHRDIANAMNNPGPIIQNNNTILFEDFNPGTPSQKYHSVNGLLPELTPSQIIVESKEKGIKLHIPQCGMTICDNPELIKNYVKHAHIYMTRKVINYRVVILANDNGDNMLITTDEVALIDREISAAFHRYSIHLKLHTIIIKNSYLHNKTVLLECYGHCPPRSDCSQQPKPECQLQCTKEKPGNRICNPECNNVENDWDSGDCCDTRYTNTSETCYDQQSKYRAYISEKELKQQLKLTNQNYLTIYPLRLPRASAYLAKATFPWVEGRFGTEGGIVIRVESFRASTNDLIHELGHTFGLWHVHRGVSDVSSCTDECTETAPSMTTGDLCEDTNPTPKNYKCLERFNFTDQCGGGLKVYDKTPFRNYMGYSAGSCANEFTKQQKARMHCYIDKTYQRWQSGNVAPSPVPLPPQVSGVYSEGKIVEIIWASPVGYGTLYNQYRCHYCNLRRKTKQYAISATYTNGLHFKHPVKQVLGTPNAVACSYFPDKFNAWYPTSSGQLNNAYLEVTFKQSVVPTAIKIWVVQRGKNAIEDLVLVHGDNFRTSLGPGTAHCDTPYTRRIKTTRGVRKVRIHFTKKEDEKQYPGVDAVEVISEQPQPRFYLHQNCRKCRKLQLQYHVIRNPPFTNNVVSRKVKGLMFIDKDIVPGKRYSYSVQATSMNHASLVSPPLVFSSTDGFCGNGIIEESNGEECDDGNNRDGDGCNVECRMEAVFNCQLQPSLCYRYDRDGVCEHHEKDEGTRDCTYLTPKGFTDQWSTHVVGKKHQSDSTCPESVIAGKPSDDLKCTLYTPDSINLTKAWFPCSGMDLVTGDVLENGWIEATFEQTSLAAAVVIYFKSDGRFNAEWDFKTVVVKLKDVDGNYHATAKAPIPVNCKVNPTIVNVEYKRKLPTFRTKAVRIEFEIGYLAIAGIAVRSQDKLCGPREFYKEETGTCEMEKKDLTPCAVFKMVDSKVECSKDGRQCDVTCNYGYVPKKNFTVYCKHGMWTKSDTCKPVHCGKLKIENAKTSCEKHILGSVCSFSCVDDSHLHGNNTEVTCQPSGRWSKQKSHCYKVCSRKPHVHNAVAVIGSCSADEESRDIYDMGTRCRFHCLNGYKAFRRVNIAGASTGYLVNVHCSGSGEWIKDSTCQPIKCPPLSRMNELMYNCTKSNMYGSTCTTTCLETKGSHSVTCQHDGKWSSTFGVCKSNVACGKFPNIKDIDVSSCQHTAYGSTCQPKCKQYGMDIVQKYEDGRKFQNNDVIFYCMPNSKWLPSPREQLSCEKKCYGYYMRNKYCDCQNNREHCSYDNGACCGNNVRFRMYHRGPKCGCIDPKFAESKRGH